MKIRPKVPVCTDCDHVFEYKGQNPGQLGGVVVQFGEAYCTKKKKPRLLKHWHNLLRVPDWCKNASIRAWCASMILPARKAG